MANSSSTLAQFQCNSLYVVIVLGWFVLGVAPFDLFVASGTIEP